MPDSTHSGERISTLIVEDEPIFRDGLKGYLMARQDVIELVGETDDAGEALRMVEEKLPQVALVDLVLHKDRQAGPKLIGDIAATSPQTRILVLTAHFEDDLLFPAIKSGAVGYLLKDNFRGEELVRVIRDVMRGDPPVDPWIAKRLITYFREGGLGPEGSGLLPGDRLSRREEEVLKLIAAGKTNKEIAASLVISEKTVKTHVSNILQKLHVSSRIEAAMYARLRTLGVAPDVRR